MARTRNGYTSYSSTHAEVKQKYEQCRSAMVEYHRTWLETYHFDRGRQDIIVNDDLRVIGRDRDGEVFVQDNRMRSAARTAVTAILPQPYRSDSRPATETPEGAAVARAQDYILSSTFDAIRFHEHVHRQCAFDFINTGRAIAKVTWTDDYADGAAKSSREGAPAALISRPSDLGGFPYIYAVSPFRWLPAPWSKPNFVPWCIEVTAMHRNDIVDRWGAKAVDGAERADSVSLSTIGLPGIDDWTANNSASSSDYTEELFVIYEYWELPTKQHKNGRYIVTTGSRELEKQKGVYELPYVWVTEVDDDDGFSGTGLMQDAVPLQKALNNQLSLLCRAANMKMNQPLLVDKNSGIAEEDLEGGKIIRLATGDQEPRYMQAPDYPSEGFNLIPVLRQEIADVTGIHDASQGAAPKNLRSGAGIDAITQNDQAKLMPSAEAMKEIFLGCCKRTLTVFRDNVPGPIAYSVMGPDKAYDIKQFYTHDITSFQIQMEPIPGFMMSKAEFVQAAIQLKQLGFQVDDGAVLNAVGLVDLSPTDNRELTLARRENMMMMSGQIPLPQEFEDHYLHAEICREALLGEELQMMKQENPQAGDMVQQLIIQHRWAHLSMMRGLTVQNAQQQAAIGMPQEGAQQGQAAAQQGGGRLNPSLQGAAPQAHTPDGGGTHTADLDSRRSPGGSGTY